MSIENKSVFAPAPFCVTRVLSDSESVEVVCIGPEMKVYTIDGVSGFIWRQLDGKTPLAQILKRIMSEFEVTSTKARKDLDSFIEQLLQLDLIQER